MVAEKAIASYRGNGFPENWKMTYSHGPHHLILALLYIWDPHRIPKESWTSFPQTSRVEDSTCAWKALTGS